MVPPAGDVVDCLVEERSSGADPASGRPIDYGTTRYRPPEHLAGLVISWDQTCQFPGCRIPAHRCDMEHGIPHDPVNGTGPTSETNLGTKCRRHHQVKQTPGWSVTQHPDGCTTWVILAGICITRNRHR